MSTVFAKNVNWRFAQAQKLGFVEKVKSGANFLTLIDIGVKSIIICCIQQRIQQSDFKQIIQLAKSENQGGNDDESNVY